MRFIAFFKHIPEKNAKRNIRMTLGGYQNALQELIDDDNPPIEIIMHGNMLCLTNSDHSTTSSSIGKPRIEKKFHEQSSYAIHAYAGRKILHYILREARSQVNRQRQFPGLSHHGTLKYTILNTYNNIEKSIVVTHFIRSNLHKDKMLVPWSNSKKEAKVHRLFRLGTMYKALRYLRSIGLRTPLIE